IAFGIEQLIPKGQTIVGKMTASLNSAFKDLITTYNPIFVVRNAIRDVPDGVLYSKDSIGFAKKYPEAWKHILTDSSQFRIYKSLGGFGSSYFEDGAAYQYKEHNAARKYTLDQIEKANYIVEQAPRFAEFLNILQKTKKQRGDNTPLTEGLTEFTGDDLQKAMYSAADITVNFGRHGRLGKIINANLVPFFNAAMQGSSKYIRNLSEGSIPKNISKLVLKATILGVGGRLLGELLYGDDEEYKEMPERDKELYIIIKDPTDKYILSAGTGWIKIPQGRAVAFTNSLVNRFVKSGVSTYSNIKNNTKSDILPDIMSNFAGLGETTANTVAPMNPFSSNIINPALNVIGQGADRNDNKMWNGMPVESQGFENTPIDQRYDERTTATSKALGGINVFGKSISERTGLSPQEMDYLGDSYLGSIWDFGSPFLTPYAEDNPWKKSFTIDPVTQNVLSSDFYEAKQEAAYAAHDNTESSAGIVNSFFGERSSMVADLNAKIKEAQTNNKYSDQEKIEITGRYKQQINNIQRETLNNLEQYQAAAEENYKTYGNKDLAKLHTDKELFGAEYAIKNYKTTDYKKAQEMHKEKGVSYDIYFDAISEFKKYTVDNPNAAGGEVKDNKISYIVGNSGIEDGLKGYMAYKLGAITDTSLDKADTLKENYNISYENTLTAYRDLRTIQRNGKAQGYSNQDIIAAQRDYLRKYSGMNTEQKMYFDDYFINDGYWTENDKLYDYNGEAIDGEISMLGEKGKAFVDETTATGVSKEIAYDAYKVYNNLKSDEGDEGYSRKEKFIGYIDRLDISDEEKTGIFYGIYSEKANDTPTWGKNLYPDPTEEITYSGRSEVNSDVLLGKQSSSE
ncbi:MAG: hypothetical protein Q4C00_01535, partial [Bacillota bacterium]|nr:hypothetical protein [Bacillota bacterium]